MFLLFKDLSPNTLTFKFGVVEIIPKINLAKVPELPKYNFKFFLLYRPNFAVYLIIFFSIYKIFTLNLRKKFIVEKTSSDSRTFSTEETPSLIDPIKNDLIEIDLSLSTLIFFWKSLIGSLITRENFFNLINSMNIDCQNIILSL